VSITSVQCSACQARRWFTESLPPNQSKSSFQRTNCSLQCYHTVQHSTAQVSACRFTSVCVIGAVGTFREKGRVWKGFSWSRFGHFMTMDLEGQVPLYLIIDTRHRKPRARRGFDVVGGHMSALDLKAHQRGQDNSRRILPSDDRDWADKEVNNKA